MSIPKVEPPFSYETRLGYMTPADYFFLTILSAWVKLNTVHKRIHNTENKQ